MLAAAPLVGVLACATWVVTAFLTRISSLSALVALALAPVYAFFMGFSLESAVFAALATLGWIRHASNIGRILRGEEPRIGKKQSAPSGP